MLGRAWASWPPWRGQSPTPVPICPRSLVVCRSSSVPFTTWGAPVGPWPGAEIGQDFSSGPQLCPSSGKGEGSLRERTRGTGLGLLTFEQGADVPDVDAAGLHELAQRDLQEENGDSSNQGDQDIRDKEYTWGRKERVGTCTGQPFSPWLASAAFGSPGRSGWSQLWAPPWPHHNFPRRESVQGVATDSEVQGE